MPTAEPRSNAQRQTWQEFEGRPLLPLSFHEQQQQQQQEQQQQRQQQKHVCPFAGLSADAAILSFFLLFLLLSPNSTTIWTKRGIEITSRLRYACTQ